jgi:hypothetical protein
MGIVYLICPGYLKGLNRYKIGCSQHDNVSRVSSYGKDTVVFSIQGGLSNYQEVEQAIIKAFNEHFTVVSGREYYEGDIHQMKELFNNTIKSCENFEQNAEVPQEPLNDNKEKVVQFIKDYVSITHNPSDQIKIPGLYKVFRWKWPSWPYENYIEFCQYALETIPTECLKRNKLVGVYVSKDTINELLDKLINGNHTNQ